MKPTIIYSKLKNKIYHTVGIIPKSNLKYVGKGKIDTPNTKT